MSNVPAKSFGKRFRSAAILSGQELLDDEKAVASEPLDVGLGNRSETGQVKSGHRTFICQKADVLILSSA